MQTNNLADIIDSIDYADFDFSFKKINFLENSLEIDFSINDTEGSNEKTNVLLTILNHLDFFIAQNDNSAQCFIESKHPLLWQFSDIQCDLYITGKPNKSSKELAFDIMTIHYSLFKNYLVFDTNILNVLNKGNGLFQSGSKELLKKYSEILNEYGIKTSLISEILPDKKMNDLKILFIGNSYFIGKEFVYETKNCR